MEMESYSSIFPNGLCTYKQDVTPLKTTCFVTGNKPVLGLNYYGLMTSLAQK